MAIKQSIAFNSNSKYFAGFLQALINESGIKAGVSQKDKTIELILDNNDLKILNEFGSLTTKYLPHSIFIGNIDTCSENIDVIPSSFTSNAYNIALCPKCLEELSDPASPQYLDDTMRCEHYSNDETFSYTAQMPFSPHYNDGMTLLVVDPAKINTLFIMTEDEIKALFSIEKPTLKVTIKDETLQELTGKKFINIKSPFDVRSILVALNAKESEVPYLFFEDPHDLSVVVVQKNITMIMDNKGLGLELETLHQQADINRFLNIVKEAGFRECIGASLSLQHGISFMTSDTKEVKKVLKFQPFVLHEILDKMQKDGTKSRLLVNFEKKYPNVMSEIDADSEFDLFETIASILELKTKSFEALSEKSLEFRGNGGLKIDTFFNEQGFDYISFIASIISFKLADTDGGYLAYSILEALGDMAVSTLMQLHIRFKIEHFVMMGDMFANPVLYSRVLGKLQHSHPYFPKGIALDD